MASSEFREALDRLGLAQYHDGLVQEAFDSWEVLADITEEDLDALGVKLGHRRILQRAIADYRQNEPQSMPAIDQSSAPKHKTTKSNGSVGIPDHQTEASGPPRVQTGGKRKYRRHPKPDDNAPDRPPSAYVLFSNQVRESLKGQEYSFTEIAKTVGEKWQVLPPDEKAGFESRSQAMKDHYYTQLAEYKKTQDYADYQRYLVDFKAKHEPRTGKRVKEDSPASPGRRDSGDRFMSSPDTRDSSNNGSEYSRGEKRRSGFGSPRMLGRGDWRPAMPQESSTESSSSRLAMEPHHSPLPAKPTFASINGSQPHNTSHLNSHRHMSQSATPMGDHPMAVSTSIAYGFHPMLTTNGSDSPVPSLASRRSTLASEHSLPSLRHSESLSSGYSAGSPLNTSNGSLPPFNRALPSRELPPPFLTKTSSGTPSLPPIKAPGSPGIYSPQASGLATLLRAGEHLASNGSRDDARPEIYDPESRA